MKNMLKKGLISLAAVGCIAATVHASEVLEDKNGGYEVIGDGEFSIMSVTSGAMDGGYWIRGKKDGNVYSSYKHYTKEGHASVVNGKGDYKSGGWKPKDVFSTAQLTWTSSGTNKAYYNYR